MFTEHAHLLRIHVRAVCAELDCELVEFNGEADPVHLLVTYPPMLAIHAAQRPHSLRCGANTPAAVSVPACTHISGPVLLRRLLRRAPPSIIKQDIDGHARPLLRPGSARR